MASTFNSMPSQELSSLISGFIAEVSMPLSRANSAALQRTIQDYLLKRPRSGTAQFVLQAATILQQYPNHIQGLDVFLRVRERQESIQVVTRDSPSKQVELIIITSPSGGQIYQLPGAVTQPEWIRVASTTEQIRTILRQDLDFTRQISSPSWACAVTELLQHEMKYSNDAAYKALCLRNLRKIIKTFNILPPSFVVRDIVVEGNRPLSGGGFALHQQDVYKGSLKGQDVCLKVLRLFTQSIEMREKLLKDFCREALVWKQLDHPNLLLFLGVTLELFAPSFCLVSPWMSNGNLMEYLARNPEFSRISAVRDIAAAMQYLHEHKPSIVHADIRGVNQCPCPRQSPVLADFGLSAITESSGITGTSTASRAGSVRWMAPEILSLSTHGAELNQTPRDIYAFACTVLEIYTGKHPFPEYRVDFKVGQEVSESRRPSRPPDVFSDELWDLVEKCWRQDPAHRPSATDVVNSLRPDDTIQTPEQPLVEESWRQNPALRPSATDVVDWLRSTIQTQKHPVSRRVIIYPREFILHFMSICKEKPAQLPPAFIGLEPTSQVACNPLALRRFPRPSSGFTKPVYPPAASSSQ
ncbi:kinase-like domain-containing protein [Mycena floridula]|nr:kinase-like domain-containing protein [Mycena floridula]